MTNTIALAHLAATLLCGAYGFASPYPFADANALGYGHVMANSLVLTLAFLILGLVFVTVDKTLARRA